jgi:transcriptional regulator with XRE-family HTH domain
VVFIAHEACGSSDSFLAIIVGMAGSARLLLSARSAAGLTQRALARRARTSQSVIARIESGATSPSWKTLEHLLKHAGFDLQANLTMRARGHSHMLDDVARILKLTPEERLLELRNAARFFAAARRLDNGRVRS